MHRPEFDLIEWIRAQVVDRPPVRLGIGDDAAILASDPDCDHLVAIDMLMEGVHFTFPESTPQLAGRKALAVNLSDIAAMAGRPTAAFVSVALPHVRGPEFARDVHSGILELADQYQVIIAGGDTNSWNGPLVISVTVIGVPLKADAVCRKGARQDDWLFVTGALGGSLPSGKHLKFEPRIREVQRLAEIVELHAMIDISDGLAADLHHILNASQVGVDLHSASIPLTKSALSATDGRSPLVHGLSDGEDFELLFSVSAEDGQRLMREWDLDVPITKIGEISCDTGCRLHHPDGSVEALPPLGWTHSLGVVDPKVQGG